MCMKLKILIENLFPPIVLLHRTKDFFSRQKWTPFVTLLLRERLENIFMLRENERPRFAFSQFRRFFFLSFFDVLLLNS